MSENKGTSHRRIEKLTLDLMVALMSICLVMPSTLYADEITFEDNWAEAGFNLIAQDGAGVEIIYSVTSMHLEDININGEWMKNVQIPGVILPNNAGAPNLPGSGRYIAIPEGSRAELEIVDYRTEVFHNLKIAPAFEIPLETDDRPLKYEKDLLIYGTDAYYPEKPVLLSERTEIRGVDVVIVGVTPFQYNPVSGDLLVYKDLKIRVNFYGGINHFGEDRLRSRWWEPVLRQNLLNYESLPEVNLHPLRQTDEDNVEYIIIIPDDPAFIAWADSLKRWRNEQGIITGVTKLSEIGGNNSTNIENYINNAYNNWLIPPVAVLLLSDYQSSGADVYGITAPVYNYGFYSCVSDNFYADINGNTLPDLNIARITAQDNTDLQSMIGKMFNYEREPYTDPGFYQNPLIAGGWQSDRWFILCCEVIYGYMHNVLEKTPVRQYAGYSGTPSSWSTNSNTYMIINYFGPTGLGYIAATPYYLNNWTGNATGINNAINSGTFIVQHRDHGLVAGWGTPSYQIPNLSSLYNDMYPYVFSINCLTGKFNDGSQCFAEAFHRMQNGALGVMAATETSYSFVNDTFVWGVYDCMWPDFDPGYGADPVGEWNLRPGFANASGKYYLQASGWPSNPTNKDETYYLFHHHGDAFMTLFSEIPSTLTISHASSTTPSATSFTVTADDGSLIGLSQLGSVVGAAEGTGSPVSIPITGLAPGIPLRVTVTKANYYRYISDVTVEGTLPDIQVTLTPYGTPIQIPAGGGSFEYNIEGTNNEPTQVVADVWCNVTLPNGTTFGPTMGPVNDFTFGPSSSINRDRTQVVPPAAPGGTYTYNAYIGFYPSFAYDEDHFTFEKLPSDGFGDASGAWQNYGEPFEEWLTNADEVMVPVEFSLNQNHPNPFNPTTAISYKLQAPSFTNLSVYDIEGRKVAELVNGWRDAGSHEVTFDGSNLASGVYLYRLETSVAGASSRSTTGKMVLLK